MKRTFFKTLLAAASLCFGTSAWADIEVKSFGDASTSEFTFTASQTEIKWGSTLTLKGVKMTFGGGTYTSQQTASKVNYTDDCWMWNSSNKGALGTFTPNNDGTLVSASDITDGSKIPTHGSTYKFVVTEKGSLAITGKTGGAQKYYLVSVDGDNKITEIIDVQEGPSSGDITPTYSNLEAGTYYWFFLGSTVSGGRFTLKKVSFTLASLSEAYLELKDTYETAKAFYDASIEGEGLFCYPSSARNTFNTVITEAKTLLDGEPTDEQCTSKTSEVNSALATFKAAQNKPDLDKCYYIIYNNNLYLNLNSDTKWADATYYMPVLSSQPYALKFEPKGDTENGYYIKNASGTVYVYKQDGNYATAIGDKNENHYFLPEAVAGGQIKFKSSWMASYYFASSNPADGSVLGVSSSNVRSFTVTEATELSATASVTSALWGTFVAPFDVNFSGTDITAYTVTLNDGMDAIVTTEVTDGQVAANTPVLIHAESATSETFTGYSSAYYTGQPTGGVLTGTLLSGTSAPAGSYLLQKQDAGVGFYYLESAAAINQYRAWLTVPAETPVKAFVLNDQLTDAINAIASQGNGSAEYFNVSGTRLSQPTRGINIVRTADGKTKKLVVK